MSVKWGILGTARIAKKLIPAIRESSNGEIVAIASRNIENAKTFASEFDIPQAYGSYQELLNNEDISAIYNPLPNHLHKEWTIQSAKHHKHVLCEKPFALNVNEAKEMFKACKKYNVKVMEAFMYRFDPIISDIKQKLIKEEIGDVRSVSFNFSHTLEERLAQSNNYRLKNSDGGGALYDLGIYGINLCNYLLDESPINVLSSFTTGTVEGDADRTVYLQLQYPNNIICNITCSFQFYGNFLQISGTSGSIEVSNIISQNKGILISKQYQSNEVFIHQKPPFNSYVSQIEHFNECIMQNSEPIISAESTLASLEIIEKALKKLKHY